jgi:response regulator of citrate/malate metabolism
LIVEDEQLIAMDLEYIITTSGGEVVGLATDYPTAIELIAKHLPDLTLIDIYLDDGPTGLDVARVLAKEGRSFVFTSANRSRIPQDFHGAVGSIDKPYTENGVKAALGYLQKGLLDPPPSRDLPPSLRLSPIYTDRWR